VLVGGEDTNSKSRKAREKPNSAAGSEKGGVKKKKREKNGLEKKAQNQPGLDAQGRCAAE